MDWWRLKVGLSLKIGHKSGFQGFNGLRVKMTVKE